MKKLIVQILFWNAPATGAVFALTFAGIGSVLWFGLLHALVLSEIISFTLLPAWDGTISTVWLVGGAGLLLIWLYSLTVFIRALWRFASTVKQTRDFRPLRWLSAILLCGGVGSAGIYCVGNLLLMLPGMFFCPGEMPEPKDIWLQNLLGFSNNGWIWIFCVALLFLFAAYWLTAKMFAAGEKIPLPRTFGRATLILWGIFVAGYIASLGGALHESHRTAEAEAALTRRFQRPPNAAGLEQMYRGSGPIDGDFWKKNRAAQEKLPGSLTIGKKSYQYWNFVLPDQLTPEIFAAFEQYCQVNEAMLTAWESGYDTVPPLPERKFEPGNLVAILLPELSWNRSLARLENSRLLAALQKNNLPEALKAYTRLTNCCASLQREPFLIGGLVWIALENIRLNCVERLLESQQLSDLQLTEQDRKLAELELAIPVNHQQAIYSEAAFGLDALYGLATGKISGMAVAPEAFRWFFPLMWIHAARDRAFMLQAYGVKDLTHVDFRAAGGKAYFLSSMLLSSLNNAGNRFYALTARVRAVRTLIRAEAYRRQHGNFPAKLDNLPLDPFTGKSMMYRIGKTNVSETFWRKTDEGLTSDSRIRAVHAVQVWSVGPDRKDDGGADYLTPGTKIRYDDVRALIRPPETKGEPL